MAYEASGDLSHQTEAAGIATLMVDASYRCAGEFQAFIDDTFEENKRVDKYEHVASEFLFAFLHMADRVMVSERGVKFRDANIDGLATFAIREKARRQHEHSEVEAFDTCVTLLGLDANDAHAAYANCSELLVTNKPFTGNGVINKLARFVCRDLNAPNNPELHRTAVEVFAHLSQALDLKKLIAIL